MASIFSRIVAGEIPSYKLAETENCFAFLDINPLKKGHALVIPKKEVDYIFDLDDALFSELNAFAKKVGKAIEKVVPCARIGIAVVGLEVPHAHIHLIPIDNVSDMDFSKPKIKVSQTEMENIANQVARHLNS